MIKRILFFTSILLCTGVSAMEAVADDLPNTTVESEEKEQIYGSVLGKWDHRRGTVEADLWNSTFEPEVKELVFGCEYGKKGELQRVHYLPFFFKVRKYAKMNSHLLSNCTGIYSPLMRAVEQHDIMRCKILLFHGADINQSNLRHTPFSFAVDHGFFKSAERRNDILRFLIKCGADINKAGSDGRTPIMLACLKWDDGRLCKTLLHLGADPLICDKEGDNALMYGLSYSESGCAPCLEILKFLVNGSKVPLGEVLNKKNNAGRTPYDYCIKKMNECRSNDYYADNKYGSMAELLNPSRVAEITDYLFGVIDRENRAA